MEGAKISDNSLVIDDAPGDEVCKELEQRRLLDRGQMGLNLQLRRVKKMEFPEQESSKFQNRLENLVRRESQSAKFNFC